MVQNFSRGANIRSAVYEIPFLLLSAQAYYHLGCEVFRSVTDGTLSLGNSDKLSLRYNHMLSNEITDIYV
jgi:hypothetical protein